MVFSSFNFIRLLWLGFLFKLIYVNIFLLLRLKYRKDVYILLMFYLKMYMKIDMYNERKYYIIYIILIIIKFF